MQKFHLHLMVLPLLLAACGKVMQAGHPPVRPFPAHLVEVQFQGVGSSHPQSSLHVPGGSLISKQGLSVVVGGLRFQHLSTNSFTVKREGKRYLSTTYQVTNQTGRTLQGLGFVGVSLQDTDGDPSNNATAPTVPGTIFSRVQHPDGSDASNRAQDMQVGPLYSYDRTGDQAVEDFGGATYRSSLNLSGFVVSPPAGLTAQVQNFGWFVDGFFPSGTTRNVTFSTSFPLASTPDQDPFYFSFIAAFAEQAYTPWPPTFDAASSVPTDLYPRGVIAADFNEDGLQDIAVLSGGDSTVRVKTGNGDGTFNTGQVFSTGAYPFAGVARDFNHDGHLDLAVSNTDGNSISVLLGDGTGSFAAQVTYPTGAQPMGIGTSDLDRDGHPDLVVANNQDSTLKVFRGKGDGTFTEEGTHRTGDHPRGLALADFNEDGKVDVVVANMYGNTLSVLLGQGDTGLRARTDVPAGNGPYQPGVADFNQDGHLDVVVNLRTGSTLQVLLGNGAGGFSLGNAPTVGSGPYSLTVADLNGDGADDLIAAIRDHDALNVLLSNRDGTFAAPSTLATGMSPYGVAVADFNGDGKPDLVSPNYIAQTASVILQE
ncbi:FG-GAP repeat domain-containing protein [Deinococcus cellulosilyticus]|uniref:VCBS repeat-containing protein n=1 Tax=Deinococcus cellulosilyticus (strain DSM 18568 / NBRC 106333 / KACC 11606 / 5516J-15) TaxID=1223518 RepID=A0A511MWB1_DEIC1|nr:VCBS repeat-containing protein [Deinococcus cellulosilyticus]GEM44681.1 hypothetical protein DC3_03160 [Deinococcus cellulosilyticus NBRC 106333 = KACC 11606]